MGPPGEVELSVQSKLVNVPTPVNVSANPGRVSPTMYDTVPQVPALDAPQVKSNSPTIFGADGFVTKSPVGTLGGWRGVMLATLAVALPALLIAVT
jgi:hypothetical protein